MFDEFAREKGIAISNQDGGGQFIEQLAVALKTHRETPTVVHGFRIQTMFAYVAAALGGCRIITEEDAGDLFVESPNFKRPDFRMLTTAGREIFVEVKNFDQQEEPMADFVLKSDYLISIQRYASAFQKPLFFAIYWRRWQIWTLTPVDCFKQIGDKSSLNLLNALKKDEMALLGDCRIGISKPLVMRFHADSTKLRSIDSSGKAQFTIGNVSFHAGGKEIANEFEQKLAWFFLNYGTWQHLELPAKIENNELIYFDVTGVCDDPNPEQEFLIIGSLSQMISRQFNSLTVGDGEILRLSPQVDPEKLGVLIPKEHKGEALGIWRFYQQSSLSDAKKQNIVS